MVSNFDLITQSVNKFVVTPLNAFGLGGFVFDVEGDTTVNLTAEITDHYLEDNTTIQDHIAIKPKRITLKNYVGELVYREDRSSDTPVQQAVRKLTTVSAFLPTLSAAAQQAKDLIDANRASTLSLGDITLESVNKTLDYWAAVKNIVGAIGNRQQAAYTYFKALHEQKILSSVQTPFEFLPNMAIETITAVQSEQSRYISDFTITLKQIRTVSELSAAPIGTAPSSIVNQASSSASTANSYTSSAGSTAVLQGRAIDQNQFEKFLGILEGTSPKVSQGGVLSDQELNSFFDGQYKQFQSTIPIPSHP